ncbi:S26 family signal peptidase [Halopiger xanaduensis]|uniref:Peptidase S26B, signal peptidase n=1 Tax=Halopiger xanaduensis (strain DSM 18323 / JCM 14033 / SH-6) TaxID=797210 RepID=F8DA88_HALXS|nr:S26 family signal peptidase [Halopiger xanaduensis]AEH38160.1 peptidase S26B, signal peptidase [Halopiger xanaduensis SH-6]
MIRRGVVRGAQALVLVTVVALVAGQLLGQPILLGFVETGSMEPTIETGDGFVAVPAALTGEPEPDDVVVFQAQELHGGGLTTHRIVEETDRGYVTRGDANPFTDQDGDEPPVQDGQIVATALQVNGEVVTIPNLGTAVTTLSDTLERTQRWLAVTFGIRSFVGTSGLAYLLLAASLVLYVAETIRERRETTIRSSLERDGDEDEDSELDPRLIAGGLALLVVVAAVAAMVVPAGTQSYDVISAEFDSDRPMVIERGTTDEIPYAIGNRGFVPVVSYVEPGSDSVAVDDGPSVVGPRDEATVTLSITAPAETGYYPAYVTEYRYLAVLPPSVIDALYAVHPWVPYAAIVSLLGGGFYGLGRLLLGPVDPRSRRDRARRRGGRGRLRSIVRRWY